MKDWTPVRQRYLRDDLPIRLGGLAANLSRIKSFAAQEANREAVESLIAESTWFIEWTAADADVHTAADLVELQIQLARWQNDWAGIWAGPDGRRRIAEQSGAWAERVLDLSGLLNS